MTAQTATGHMREGNASGYLTGTCVITPHSQRHIERIQESRIFHLWRQRHKDVCLCFIFISIAVLLQCVFRNRNHTFYRNVIQEKCNHQYFLVHEKVSTSQCPSHVGIHDTLQKYPKARHGGAWWRVTVVWTLGRLQQEDDKFEEFEATLG